MSKHINHLQNVWKQSHKPDDSNSINLMQVQLCAVSQEQSAAAGGDSWTNSHESGRRLTIFTGHYDASSLMVHSSVDTVPGCPGPD
jgi:hypothetical protein